MPLTIYDRSPRNVPTSQIALINSSRISPPFREFKSYGIFGTFYPSLRNVNLTDFREFFSEIVPLNLIGMAKEENDCWSTMFFKSFTKARQNLSLAIVYRIKKQQK